MNFRRRDSTQAPGFQIAPMIDIIFLMLCFFVTSQIFSQWETEIDVQLPTAEKVGAPERLPGEVIINVLDDGTTIVNRRVLDREGLGSLLRRVSEHFPGQPVLVRGDRRTDYEHIIRVLDLCRQADIWNISFATTSSEKSTTP
jgi:biopolymer transport protein ExbD